VRVPPCAGGGATSLAGPGRDSVIDASASQSGAVLQTTAMSAPPASAPVPRPAPGSHRRERVVPTRSGGARLVRLASGVARVW